MLTLRNTTDKITFLNTLLYENFAASKFRKIWQWSDNILFCWIFYP